VTRLRFKSGFGRLEVVLVLVVITLVAQLIPWGTRRVFISILDVRTWNSRAWFVANALMFLSMFAIRFGPAVGVAARQALLRWKTSRLSPTNAHEHGHLLTAVEEQALYQRMNEARKKQVV